MLNELTNHHKFAILAVPGGPAVPTGPTAVAIKAAGGYVRTDSTAAPATVGMGTGTTDPEKYLCYNAADQASIAPIQPGDTTILKSMQSGQYCRLAACPAAPLTKCMLCDQSSAATASAFQYTGSGLSYDHVPMVSAGPGQPLTMGASVASINSVQLFIAVAGTPAPVAGI